MTMPTQAVLIKADGEAVEWPEAVTEVLVRFGLGGMSDGCWKVSDDFTVWLKTCIGQSGHNSTFHEHRFVPGDDKTLFLALLPWQGNELYALHIFETGIINDNQAVINTLTQREVDVLHWVAEGKSNEDISSILKISQGTVRKHIENLLKKMHVENRTAAARFYMDMWQQMHG